jgi:hypothetical protein
MGSRVDDGVYWHFFTITVNYNSSHNELHFWTTSPLLMPMRNLSLLSESRTNLYYYFDLSTLLFWIHESTAFYNLPRTSESPPCWTVNFLWYPVGCHGNLVFINLLPGNDSLAAICCNGNVITEPLLSKGHLAPLFRLSSGMSQYFTFLRLIA